MTPRELLEAFETLADAPDGVKRLRELVLHLAVHGKLVSQAPGDGDATIAVADAQNNDSWRISGRERCAAPESERDASTAALPLGWAKCRLGQITQLINGRAYSQPELLDTGTPVIRIQNLNGGERWYYSNLELSERQYCTTGDLLFAWSASFGPYIWDGGRAIYHYHIWKLQLSPAVALRFMFYVLQHTTEAVRDQSHGLAMLHMTKAKMESWPLLLPPLREQHRIVARVDELMGLLDRLEAARAVRDEVRRAARDAALAALRDAEDTEAVEIAWARISGQMDALFNTPEDVVPLRQTILQLAVRARLVPQDPFDEPGSLLAERLAQEKTNLHRGGLGPAPKPLDSIVTAPFSLPPSWTWVRADLACSQIVDCLHRTPPYVETGFPAIRTCDVEPGRILVDRALRVDEPTFREQTQRLLPREGDVLYSREGGRFGIAAVVPQGVVLCLSQRMMQLRCLDSIDPEYFSWFLNSPFGFGQASADVGGSASPHVNISSIRQFLFPLPPEREQRRISGQIKSMMALCEDLEARLSTARELQARFAAAAVHHLDV